MSKVVVLMHLTLDDVRQVPGRSQAQAALGMECLMTKGGFNA